MYVRRTLSTTSHHRSNVWVVFTGADARQRRMDARLKAEAESRDKERDTSFPHHRKEKLVLFVAAPCTPVLFFVPPV